MIIGYVYGEVSGGILGSTLWYGSFFFLGAWAVRFVQHWVKSHWLLILPLFSAAAYFAHLGVHDRELRVGTFEAAGISALGIAVILWLAARLPRIAPVRFVEWVGRSSIVVYVAHFPIIIIARGVITGWELSAGACAADDTHRHRRFRAAGVAASLDDLALCAARASEGRGAPADPRLSIRRFRYPRPGD